MYCVYKHTNLKNGKVYIGVTSQKPSRRWHGGHGYSDQPLFWNAIQKYGWENFNHEILAKNLSQDDAFRMEQELIKEYRSTDREYGYNISGGGVDSSRFTLPYRESLSRANRQRPPMSMETREKIAKARTGTKMPPCSEKTRRKLSESLTGRVFSKEHRKHISESKKGVFDGANNPRARKVRCLETGFIFSCLKDAALATGTSNHNISAVCNGRLKTSGGFHWEYVKEV